MIGCGNPVIRIPVVSCLLYVFLLLVSEAVAYPFLVVGDDHAVEVVACGGSGFSHPLPESAYGCRQLCEHLVHVPVSGQVVEAAERPLPFAESD